MDFSTIPVLGSKLEELLPATWLLHAYSSKDHRAIRVYGPMRRRGLYSRHTIALIRVYPDRVQIVRNICTQGQYDQIKAAIKKVTGLHISEPDGAK